MFISSTEMKDDSNSQLKFPCHRQFCCNVENCRGAQWQRNKKSRPRLMWKQSAIKILSVWSRCV